MPLPTLTITDSPRKRYRLFKKKPAGAGYVNRGGPKGVQGMGYDVFRL